MKKIHILALSTAIALGTMVTSCEGGSSTPSANLKTDVDTLSYAYGVTLAESGLYQHMMQLGVVQDTAMFKATLQHQVTMEPDSAKRLQIEKKINSQVDSLRRANNKNMNQFVKGLNETFNTTNKDKDAYVAGLQIGIQLKQMVENFETSVFENTDNKINKNAMVAGILNSAKNQKLAVEDARMVFEQKMQEVQEAAQKKQDEELRGQYTDKIAENTKFLEDNKANEGVVTLPSGLQYKVVKEGNGPTPTATDRVKVYYKGTLIDGQEFDATRGTEPTPLSVGGVIKGWTEALQLMPVGSKWILYIPEDLAYGSQQAGQIPPFSTLIFELELVGIE